MTEFLNLQNLKRTSENVRGEKSNNKFRLFLNQNIFKVVVIFHNLVSINIKNVNIYGLSLLPYDIVFL